MISPSERSAMIRKDNTDLSLTRHFKLLKIRRPSIYYTPVGFDQATIDLMHEIGRIFTRLGTGAAGTARRAHWPFARDPTPLGHSKLVLLVRTGQH